MHEEITDAYANCDLDKTAALAEIDIAKEQARHYFRNKGYNPEDERRWFELMLDYRSFPSEYLSSKLSQYERPRVN